jgi:hypothetical protein
MYGSERKFTLKQDQIQICKYILFYFILTHSIQLQISTEKKGEAKELTKFCGEDHSSPLMKKTRRMNRRIEREDKHKKHVDTSDAFTHIFGEQALKGCHNNQQKKTVAFEN